MFVDGIRSRSMSLSATGFEKSFASNPPVSLEPTIDERRERDVLDFDGLITRCNGLQNV